jgi:inorganic pyrophosphatase
MVSSTSPVELEVVIEIPRWSFLKRGSTGRVDFVSPVPCPFNYGSVRGYIGGDEDFLDAIVLGPRLPRGARVSVRVHGAIGLTDRDMYDDKLVCSRGPLKARDRRLALLYMNLYGWLKRALNRWRGRPGRTACEGWQDAQGAIARARPCEEGAGARPAVPF